MNESRARLLLGVLVLTWAVSWPAIKIGVTTVPALWVVPLAAWRLRERMSRRALGGVAAGLVGVLVIAVPDIRLGGNRQVLAYAMLMGPAAAWATALPGR